MKIFFKAEDQCDFYFCFEPEGTNKIVLPENISLSNFLFFLQGSLDQIKPVVILKNAVAKSEVDLPSLKSTHHNLDKENFLFLNFSIRNSLKSDTPDVSLKNFEDIRNALIKILKK